MKTYKQYITEMARPTKKETSKTYWHGTSIFINFKKYGIVPWDVKLKEKTSSTNYTKERLIPMKGMVYITDSLNVALFHTFNNGNDIGFLFEISGKELNDIFPDEDDINLFLSDCKRYEVGTSNFKKDDADYFDIVPKGMSVENIYSFFKKHDTISYGDGKKAIQLLMKHKRDDIIRAFINGNKIAHKGKIKPSHCYEIKFANLPEKIKLEIAEGGAIPIKWNTLKPYTKLIW